VRELDNSIRGAIILKEWNEKQPRNKKLNELIRCYETIIFSSNRKDLKIMALEAQVKALTDRLVNEGVQQIIKNKTQ
jgi:hypothetical protein